MADSSSGDSLRASAMSGHAPVPCRLPLESPGTHRFREFSARHRSTGERDDTDVATNMDAAFPPSFPEMRSHFPGRWPECSASRILPHDSTLDWRFSADLLNRERSRTVKVTTSGVGPGSVIDRKSEERGRIVGKTRRILRLDEFFEKLDLPTEEYTFIDFGSGKGRVLFFAL